MALLEIIVMVCMTTKEAAKEKAIQIVVREAICNAIRTHAEDWDDVASAVLKELRSAGYKIKKKKEEGEEKDAGPNSLLSAYYKKYNL